MKISIILQGQLTRFIGQFLTGELAHPLLLSRELVRLSDLAWTEAESSLGNEE